MRTLTKADLAEKISLELGLSASACGDIVSEIFHKIFEITKKYENIHIKNFGSFKFFEKKARPGRNISKNQALVIKDKKVIRFSASRNLREQLNEK